MSYILDAIKKTESGQKDGDVPNLNSEHQHTAFIEEDETKRWLLPLLVVIAILFVVVIWLLLKPVANPDKNDYGQEASKDSITEPTLSEAAVTTETSNLVPDTKLEPVNVSGSANSTGLLIKKAPLEVQQPVVQKRTEQRVETVSRKPITEVVQDTQVRQTVSSNSKPVFLAAIDHDHWPTIIYTTHIYATKPEDRFVMLNGRAYSIGDTITKGMTVVDIMENDLLVEYQGQKVIVPGLSDVNP